MAALDARLSRHRVALARRLRFVAARHAGSSAAPAIPPALAARFTVIDTTAAVPGAGGRGAATKRPLTPVFSPACAPHAMRRPAPPAAAAAAAAAGTTAPAGVDSMGRLGSGALWPLRRRLGGLTDGPKPGAAAGSLDAVASLFPVVRAGREGGCGAGADARRGCRIVFSLAGLW